MKVKLWDESGDKIIEMANTVHPRIGEAVVQGPRVYRVKDVCWDIEDDVVHVTITPAPDDEFN